MSKEVLLSSFIDQAYLSSLRRSQNSDGGWGFRAGYESRAEPTTWALIAFQEFSSPARLNRVVAFLTFPALRFEDWELNRS